MDFHTTEPERVNAFARTGPDPFASTFDDPREVQQLVRAAMKKAQRQRAAGLAPRKYWEEPGHHGAGREISLRPPRAVQLYPATKAQVHKALRLPPIPKTASIGVGTLALIATGVVGVGLLAGYLVGKRQKNVAVLGADELRRASGYMVGFDVLGAEP